MSVGSLRIIAGSLKGRKIPVPEAEGVRPTPDRVREALFSILGESVRGARVLDAFAGSGALGLEAWSRGASAVVFLEADRRVCHALRATLDDLGATAACRAVLGRAEGPPGRIMDVAPFDLILADPPYGGSAGPAFLQWISAPGVVSRRGQVILEREAAAEPAGGEDSRFGLVRTARYGRTALDFYTVSNRSEPRPA